MKVETQEKRSAAMAAAAVATAAASAAASAAGTPPNVATAEAELPADPELVDEGPTEDDGVVLEDEEIDALLDEIAEARVNEDAEEYDGSFEEFLEEVFAQVANGEGQPGEESEL
jgi:hypothetical protein